MPQNVQTGTSTLTLLIVAIAGGIIALSLQPLVLILYSYLGLPTVPITYQPPSIPIEQTTIIPITTTTVATTQQVQTTTVTMKNDPTVDEELVVREQSKVSQAEDASQSNKLKKATQQPQLIDITGRNKEIPDEVKNFQSTRISRCLIISRSTSRRISFLILTFSDMIKTKKLWIPIPNSNGGHRRVPPVSIRTGKEHNSTVK